MKRRLLPRLLSYLTKANQPFPEKLRDTLNPLRLAARALTTTTARTVTAVRKPGFVASVSHLRNSRSAVAALYAISIVRILRKKSALAT
jgi:hypothetical protein